MFGRMNEQSSPPTDTPVRQGDGGAPAPVRPVQIGRVNWVGLQTLYLREVQRFAKVGMQTVVAPVITSMLFLMVFVVAVGDRSIVTGLVGLVLVNSVLWFLCYRVLKSGWRLKS